MNPKLKSWLITAAIVAASAALSFVAENAAEVPGLSPTLTAVLVLGAKAVQKYLQTYPTPEVSEDE